MRDQELCVVHVAAADDREALNVLVRTTQVIATLGVGQVLLALETRPGAHAAWVAAIAAEVRLLRCSGVSIVRRIHALQGEFATLLREKTLCAVHLHGLAPCLLGVRALRGCALHARVLYSWHREGGRPWAAALLGRVLRSQLSAFDYAPLAGSLTEAQALSKLLNRSAEVLPHSVGHYFFIAARHEDPRPSVLIRGSGAEALDLTTRLCVLLNGRGPRVHFRWLGGADGSSRAQLEAASVQVLECADDRETARLLSGAWLFVQMAERGELVLGLAQAMAAGLPCLASDIPAHRALIHHGETGFICTSERDFLEKMVHLLRDRPERVRIGLAARAEAERRFTLRGFREAVLRAYGFSWSEALQPVAVADPPRALSQS